MLSGYRPTDGRDYSWKSQEQLRCVGQNLLALSLDFSTICGSLQGGKKKRERVSIPALRHP